MPVYQVRVETSKQVVLLSQLLTTMKVGPYCVSSFSPTEQERLLFHHRAILTWPPPTAPVRLREVRDEEQS